MKNVKMSEIFSPVYLTQLLNDIGYRVEYVRAEIPYYAIFKGNREIACIGHTWEEACRQIAIADDIRRRLKNNDSKGD